ncbi:hypothetical protein [Kordia jejudonensis]|nr:hypothetical protein [Kordia jejudonensis]
MKAHDTYISNLATNGFAVLDRMYTEIEIAEIISCIEKASATTELAEH